MVRIFMRNWRQTQAATSHHSLSSPRHHQSIDRAKSSDALPEAGEAAPRARSVPLHRAIDLAFIVRLALGGAFVVLLLVGHEAQLDLDLGALEVERQGDQRVALDERLGAELLDLALVEQELAYARNFVLPAVGLRVLVDLHAVDVGLALADLDPAVGDGHLGLAQALDFGANERDAGLEPLVDMKVVRRLAVGGDHTNGFCGGLGHHHSPTFGIVVHGSAGARAGPFWSSSTEIRSGDRMNAIRPS